MSNGIMPPFDYNLYFDEDRHKYYDDFNNPLTSVTTVIGKYEWKFNVDEMARVCWKSGLRGNEKYRGKSVEQIKTEWDKVKTTALAQGNEKHNYLEIAVKDASQFYRFHHRHPGNNRRLYTIPDVIQHPGYGELSLNDFIATGIKDRYPDIFYVIEMFVKQGYRIYSEIGTFNVYLLVTGLIDILLIKDKRFIILDWKTNKARVRFDAGYWEKDKYGESTNVWIPQDHMFKEPLNTLASSVGNKYALQLAIYSYLTMQFGLTLDALVLCQIIQSKDDKGRPYEEVYIDKYPELINEAKLMLDHHLINSNANRQYAAKLF